MSSPHVRSTFTSAWPTKVPDIPFFGTINTSPTNLEVELPIWATAIFDVTSRGHETMGKNPWIVENGSINIALMSYSGVGDDEVALAAEKVMRAFELWYPDSSLWIQSVDGPRPPDLESVGDVYRLLVVLNYTYQTRGGS